ncbi:MAG: lipid-A-disaccharide synthase [Melioribacter sp.]|nr:lipid-A-disaccharide synthase [Melioribacter sp.]
MKNKLMIITGEASGDLHAAALIKKLKDLDSSLEFCGIGGDKMIAVGFNAIFHIKEMAFLGFIEIIKHLPFIKYVQKRIIDTVNSEKINTIILVDYPGFNLRLAKKLKKLNKKIIYYISPQIWAWGKNRIKKIKKFVDKMIVVFPFEEKIYKEHDIDVVYTGHPLIEHIKNYNFLSREELFEKFNLNKEKEILLLLPGSRKHEIKKIFPETLKASQKLAEEFNLQIVVACADNINENIFYKLSDYKNYKIIKGHTYDLFKYSYFGIIKSGTSTLEAGIFQLPFIVVYATNYLTYLLGRLLVQVENISMVNILLEEKVVEELIQSDMNCSNIYSTSYKILSDKKKYNEIKQKLSLIKSKLGETGAIEKAAKAIYSVLNEA